MGLFNLFGSSKPKAKAPKAAPAAVRPEHKVEKLSRRNITRRFQIIAETAQGSMSRIYKAIDTQHYDRTVCLKIQHRERTAAARARTVTVDRPTEGEIGRRISHPNVCKIFDYGLTHKGDYFLAMEFIDGYSLDYVRQSRVLSIADKLRFLAQGADGLAAVHAAGFIHHDIANKNFLIDRNDVIKLIDFGLTVPNIPDFNKPGNRTGTLNYMAPELVKREATDERIDIFSFGAVMFEFMTGKLPYDGVTSLAQMLQRINQDPIDPARANPQLPEPVCALIRKTLARKPSERWPRMASLAVALRELAEEADPGGGEKREL